MAGPLRNTRQERFCVALAQGRTIIEAYELAGYKPDRGAASRLSSKASVRQRITELQTTLATESMTAATLTNDWIIERLIENATEAMKAGHRRTSRCSFSATRGGCS